MERMAEQSRLRQFIAQESDGLRGTLRFYLLRAGLIGQGQPPDGAVSELLNEVVAEALSHEDRFMTAAQPKPWLLGIAANLIRRKQVDLARRNRREPLLRDLYPALDDVSDDELFDRVAALVELPEAERDESLSALLDGLSQPDSHILRLAVVNGLSGDTLARELGISPGAARVRLHRALGRLRDLHNAKGESRYE